MDRLVYPHCKAPGADRRDREKWHHQSGNDEERVYFHSPLVRCVVDILWHARHDVAVPVVGPWAMLRALAAARAAPISIILSARQMSVINPDQKPPGFGAEICE